MIPLERIRNFGITAHIDHGKSTLADRLLESTGTIDKRQMKEQVLDSLDLERERGITIKLTPVRMEYKGHVLNLIDTPGHVDFAYEVSRSLAAVEGAVLLVDATQGVQAQTLANLALALDAGLTIIPVVNKIDLPVADVAGTRSDLAHLTGVPESDILLVSGKTGQGVSELLDAIVQRIPPPSGKREAPFRALVFDSLFDAYRGVVAYVRVVDGTLSAREPVLLAGESVRGDALDLGTFRPKEVPQDVLAAGEIGYIATGLRDVAQVRVGDTIIRHGDRQTRATLALPGYVVPQPKVFAGLYPVRGDDFQLLREALGKYRLNDASLQFQQESSPALGQGFRCGFLGLLHLSIVRERLKREYNVDVTMTVPSVAYRLTQQNGEVRVVRTPAEYPDPSSILSAEEQWARAEIVARAADVGGVLTLVTSHDGIHRNTEYLAGNRILVTAELPLREVIIDFYDALKSATSGYGSLSYDLLDWRPADLVKVAILVAGETVEPLAVILPAQKAQREGRRIVERLKTAIPRHLFPIPLQAAIGGKVIARETIPALRKDVTGYLYGGDVTRKRKLLEKQKKGKKRLAKVSDVEIPPEAFLAALGRNE
jgi:GTP-binding protein LepA